MGDFGRIICFDLSRFCYTFLTKVFWNVLYFQEQNAVPVLVFAWRHFNTIHFQTNCWTIYFPQVEMIQHVSQATYFSLAGRISSQAVTFTAGAFTVNPSFLPAKHLRRTCWQTLKWTLWLCFLAEIQFLPCGPANRSQHQGSYGLHNDGWRSGRMLNPDSEALGGSRRSKSTRLNEL